MKIPRKLYLYFHGIGDSLLFNTVLFHLGCETGNTFIVGSQHPEIYQGNPYVRHLPCKSHAAVVYWRRLLKFFKIVSKVEYINYNQHGSIPPKHIFALLCERVGLLETPKRPIIFLTPEEKSQNILPKSNKPWIAIQSTGNSAHTELKNWSVEKFQEVAAALRQRYAIVQFGLCGDPPLDVDLNLCGKLTARQLFVAIGECLCLVGQEGFLVHVAAAKGIPSVVVYGGFSAPWQTGYEWNYNLYNPLPCAPCWLWGKQCPYSKRCMNEISSQQVIESFNRLMSRLDGQALKG
jgi:Glycosyltransferase family 9 (heptosyltransferase)